jgi:SAM-dependent methyltransferase
MTVVTRAKSIFQSTFPATTATVRKMKDYYRMLRYGDLYMERIFSRIYRENVWGNPESVSGRSSTLSRTEVVRQELPGLLRRLDAKSLLDAPCGDFNWMRHVELGATEYIGGDVVPDLVELNRRRYGGRQRSFIHLDITKDEVPRVDVILCRDFLIHLSFRYALSAIANLRRSGSQYLLATTYPTVPENCDAHTGGWRPLNLQLPPFNFPQPLELITENQESGKCLGLWRLGQL